MAERKNDFGLIIKLLVGLVAGAAIGRYVGPALMDVIVSLKHVLGQIIFYAVPLVIIGFIAPAIARLGRQASTLLLTAIVLAYLSSVGRRPFRPFQGISSSPISPFPPRSRTLFPCPSPRSCLTSRRSCRS